ncbi:MAG: hypothetical protein HQL32_04410 [Planctomycetes bacterium]|nr:hypothetical protein [Planctomycetota bacterium]
MNYLNKIIMAAVTILIFLSNAYTEDESNIIPIKAKKYKDWVDAHIHESSGLEQSSMNHNVYYTHNDNSQNWIACARRNGTYLGRIYFSHNLNVLVDAEDMSIGPGPINGKSYIYYGTIGDNGAGRVNGIQILRMVEPEITEEFGRIDVTSEVMHYIYPDGPRDAETLFVDPNTKDIYIISKRDKRPRVYVARYPQPIDTTTTLEYLGELPQSIGRGITGGDMSRDGKHIILCTNYKNTSDPHFFHFQKNENQTVYEALSQEPEILYTDFIHPQREAVCWNNSATSFYASTEGSMYLTYYSYHSKPNIVVSTPENGQLNVTKGKGCLFELSANDDGAVVALNLIINDHLDLTVQGDSYSSEHFLSHLETGEYTLRITAYDNAGYSRTKRRQVIVLPNTLDEAKYVTGKVTAGHHWETVNFYNPINNPVVVVSPASYNGHQGAFPEIRNVNKDGFEVHIREWNHLDGSHVPETINYFAVEAGVHSIKDFSIQASVIQVSESDQSRYFPGTFSSSPVVFSTVASSNNEMPVTSFVSEVESYTYMINLEKEEGASNITHHESVHVIAINTGNNDSKTIKSGLTSSTYHHDEKTLDFRHDFTYPTFFMQTQTKNGVDPYVIRWIKNTLKSDSVDIFLQEETSSDSEIEHANESIGWLVFEQE